MRLLIVTEKCGPEDALRDGGARLVSTLRRAFGEAVSVAQFGEHADASATWHYRYPAADGDRFARRLARAGFIGDSLREIASGFTDILYVHASMQFAAPATPARAWTFPMFLTPSYTASGENVPEAYTSAERHVLATTDRVLTPSHLERRQLVDLYGVPEDRIRVVPRGVDRALLAPRVRRLDGPPLLCSVGSIKRQKNTIGLVRLYAQVRAHYPGAKLRVIGPVQDAGYAAEVRDEVARLGVTAAVEFVGHVPPEHLATALADAHLHVSAATCETFGRAIFETLASGLPNVARARGNAAAEFLDQRPYARFLNDDGEAVAAVDALLADLPRLSGMAAEVGELFDDEVLARLLSAEVGEADVLAVADWDGTLFHKADTSRTTRSIDAFRRFPRRVVCTARSVPDVVDALRAQHLAVDWVIGCGGAVVADGHGTTLWRLPVPDTIACERRVLDGGEVVQLAGVRDPCDGLRVETYQGVSFAAAWEASKLHAVVRLLRHLDWRGRVRAFGDGRYDEELLAYFDGVRIRPEPIPCVSRQATEITHV